MRCSGRDAQVLNRPPGRPDRESPCTVPQYSGRPPARRPAFDQPGGLGEEAGLADNLRHQPAATAQLAQAGEDVGVDFPAETQVLRLGEGVQQRRMPGQKAIAAGQRRGVKSRPARSISMRYRLKYVSSIGLFSLPAGCRTVNRGDSGKGGRRRAEGGRKGLGIGLALFTPFTPFTPFAPLGRPRKLAAHDRGIDFAASTLMHLPVVGQQAVALGLQSVICV